MRFFGRVHAIQRDLRPEAHKVSRRREGNTWNLPVLESVLNQPGQFRSDSSEEIWLGRKDSNLHRPH
jgi:hypothetical protein